MTTLRLAEWETRSAVRLSPLTAARLRATFKARVEPSVIQDDSAPRWDVTASGVVGAARWGDDEVAVVPKVDIENVLFLLAVGSGRDPWRAAQDAELARAPDLSAAVTSLFVRLAHDALGAGVLRGYRQVDADLPTVRGRIDLARQLRSRPGQMLPLAVSYSEHDEDVLENRLLLAASRLLTRLPHAQPNTHTWRGLHRVRRVLADVTELEVHPMRVPVVSWNRLNAHYRPAVELARTVLGRGGVEVDLGTTRALGITLDMAKVFEDFVCTALGSVLMARGGRTTLQDKAWVLDTERNVHLQPDLVWYRSSGAPRAVVDAKYKRERPAGYPEADVYQLLAYCTALDLNHGHLVYAKGNDAVRSAHVVNGGPSIYAHALDLSAQPRVLLEQIESIGALVDVPIRLEPSASIGAPARSAVWTAGTRSPEAPGRSRTGVLR